MSEIYKALVAFQKELPNVSKGNTAKAGSFSYKYADLTDVTEKIMPLLSKHGLAFTARPTLNHAAAFVLHYSLVHTTGEMIGGEYPLPSHGSPQEIGSAITYARRYALVAITGVAPGGDDDDAAAAMAIKPKAKPVEPVKWDKPLLNWDEELAQVTDANAARGLFALAKAEGASQEVLDKIIAKGKDLA
jgi:hypothetical protein